MGIYNPNSELTFTRIKGSSTITSAGTTYTNTVSTAGMEPDGVVMVSVGDMATDATDTMVVTAQGAYGSTTEVLDSTTGSYVGLRLGAADNVKLAYDFTTAQVYEGISSIFLWLKHNGTVASGNVFVSLEGDSAGDPDGTTIQSASANVDATTISTSGEWVEFTFAEEIVLGSGVDVHIILEGTYTASGTNYISWGMNDVGSSGLLEIYDSSWANDATDTPNVLIEYRDYSDIGTVSLAGDGTGENAVGTINVPQDYSHVRCKMVGVSGNSLSAPLESISIAYGSKTS